MKIMNLMTELFVLFLLFVNVWSKDKKGEENKCFIISSCGYTVPEGDIFLNYGQSLNITCNLYEDVAKNWASQNKGRPSSRLYFTRNEKIIHPNNPYDPNNKTAERVFIINDTTILLTIEKPEKTEKDNFYCYFNQSMEKRGQLLACNNIVVVGVPPQNVTDFSCVSENYENLVCTWTAPENYALTQYELSYYVKPLNTRSVCPSYPQYDNESNNMSCNWTLFTTPHYRQSKSKFKFELHMNNSFGNNTQVYYFDHYKHMRPKPVENVVAVATSSHSINVSWSFNSKLEGFLKPLEGKIIYSCEYCNQSWYLGGNFVWNGPKVTNYELTNLQYAHSLYDIRISIKPKEADDSMWSEKATVTERTFSEIPQCPPKVTIGSYEIINTDSPKKNRDIFVYFQQIRVSEENGQNLTYEVETIPSLPIAESTKAYVKFVNLDLKEYIIRIWSKNEIGRSLLSSRVVIPAEPLEEPQQFFKIERSTNTYELEWERPKIDQNITNYTLFWCTNDKERPHQCKGYLDWIVVSKETLKYNLTLQSGTTYHFAIAVNNEHSSSGMKWTECTVVPNRPVGKIRNVWVNSVGSNFVELMWKLDCSDIPSEVTGYVIFYCITSSLSGTTCKEWNNVTISGNLSVQSFKVNNLTPYTTYLLALSVRSKRGLSQHSDYLRNVTLESAPSTPPLNIKITRVTNSSITVKWSPPSQINGLIKSYRIILNDFEKVIDSKKDTETLTDLESYKKYTIYMRACTVSCSNNSESQTVVTKMGIPTKINRLYLIKSNDTISIISWNKPNPPRGELNYYQLSITHDGADLNNGDLINFSIAENYTIENCREAKQYHSFYVSIRAVNIIDGEHYPGPWSDTVKIYCYRSSWYIIIYILVAVVASVVLVVGIRKLYICWKIARDVEVKLPPGLAPAVEHSEKNSEIIDRNFSHDPDEELLLKRMTEKCQTGDSSGCSSGQESISSSVESSHLSMDSGTDQPRNVADDKENSLRLRNVSIKGYVMHDPTPMINRGTKPAPTPAGNYCLIGVDPCTKSIQDTPYVMNGDTLPPYNSDQPLGTPPPYVLTDIFKTPNPGYVPFSPKEPASKNTGYVLAGDLISTPTSDVKIELMAETPEGLKPATVWQQPPIEQSVTKPGYVIVGDAPPPMGIKEISKGYVPHRQFESKTLKED